MSTLIHSVRLVDDGRVSEGAWVSWENGVVTAVGAGADHPKADDVIDGAGLTLTPGFIDIHGHGGATAAFDDGADAILTARAMHRSHGTTRAVISLVTASIDDLASRVAAIADLADADPTILGSHLEGPFLDVGHKGAHTPSLLRAPDAASVDRLVATARGTLRQITLAPELEGADAAIRRFAASGVTVAVGHTDATDAQARAAFEAGATLLTHAFNAMPGILHRAPGPIVPALRDERVVLELIADGVHVDLDLIAVMFTVAPNRIALITDAMAAAGAADGAYELGGLAVTVDNGVARLVEGGAIAGSTLTQDVALRNVVGAGVPLATAVRALTQTPARAVGRPDLGTLAVGSPADAVLLDADLHVQRVWAGGTET